MRPILTNIEKLLMTKQIKTSFHLSTLNALQSIQDQSDNLKFSDSVNFIVKSHTAFRRAAISGCSLGIEDWEQLISLSPKSKFCLETGRIGTVKAVIDAVRPLATLNQNASYIALLEKLSQLTDVQKMAVDLVISDYHNPKAAESGAAAIANAIIDSAKGMPDHSTFDFVNFAIMFSDTIKVLKGRQLFAPYSKAHNSHLFSLGRAGGCLGDTRQIKALEEQYESVAPIKRKNLIIVDNKLYWLGLNNTLTNRDLSWSELQQELALRPVKPNGSSFFYFMGFPIPYLN